MVTDTSYFCVQSWMVTKLGLRTVERDCYAIIYGYSMDGESDYHGSLAYLSEMTGYSRNSICTALKNLTDNGLIIKLEETINNIKFCHYKTNMNVVSDLYGVQTACTPVQTTCTNNIVNNNKSTLSKDNVKYDAEQDRTEYTMVDLLADKPKKKNLYQKCLDMINDFTNDMRLQELLVQYLDLLLEKMRSEGKMLYANQFKGMLNKLDDLCEGGSYGAVVQQSIQKGYIGFFPVSSYSKPKNYVPDTNKAPQHKAGEKARNDDGTLKEY